MNSRRLLLPALAMTATLAGPSPAQAASSCQLAGNLALSGSTFVCSYDGLPPTASLTTEVVAGTVSFLWTCDTRVDLFQRQAPAPPAPSPTSPRPRAAVESCTLAVTVLEGPATFSATAT